MWYNIICDIILQQNILKKLSPMIKFCKKSEFSEKNFKIQVHDF